MESVNYHPARSPWGGHHHAESQIGADPEQLLQLPFHSVGLLKHQLKGKNRENSPQSTSQKGYYTFYVDKELYLFQSLLYSGTSVYKLNSLHDSGYKPN